MQKLVQLLATIVLSGLLLACYVPGRGYAESQFDLVLDSRLPKFFDPTGRISPAGYKVRVEYYSSAADESPSVRVIIRDPLGRTVFDKQDKCWWHPKSPQPGQGKDPTYPQYTVVSFDGVVDIFEQRAAEPIEHLSDDPDLWSSLK